MERNVLTQKPVNLWNSLRKYAAEAQSRPSIQILRCKANDMGLVQRCNVAAKDQLLNSGTAIRG